MVAPARKRVAVVQSNYIPWRGYFDLIGLSDEFILYDECQYTKNDWRNRNKIKTSVGPLWLTIPVVRNGRSRQRIDEAVVADDRWRRTHWKAIAQSYAAARHFRLYADWLESLYSSVATTRLSEINRRFIDEICTLLGIDTRITWSSDYAATGGRSERVLDLCLKAGATEYLSGPAARSYLDEAAFAEAGVRVVWMDYSAYGEYAQLHGSFEAHVSILDLLLNEGPNAARHMQFGAAA